VWRVEFYSDTSGTEPVKNFVVAQDYKHRVKILRAFQLLQEFGPLLREPHAKHVGGGLWELRIRSGRNAYRILYFLHADGAFVLLHALQKKQHRLPPGDIEIAEKRRADHLSRR